MSLTQLPLEVLPAVAANLAYQDLAAVLVACPALRNDVTLTDRQRAEKAAARAFWCMRTTDDPQELAALVDTHLKPLCTASLSTECRHDITSILKIKTAPCPLEGELSGDGHGGLWADWRVDAACPGVDIALQRYQNSWKLSADVHLTGAMPDDPIYLHGVVGDVARATAAMASLAPGFEACKQLEQVVIDVYEGGQLASSMEYWYSPPTGTECPLSLAFESCFQRAGISFASTRVGLFRRPNSPLFHPTSPQYDPTV